MEPVHPQYPIDKARTSKRHTIHWQSVSICALLGLAATACTDVTGVDQVEPVAPVELSAKPGPSPQKEACTDPEDPSCLPGDNDPNPSAPGYYIDVAGSSMSRSWCQTNGNDSDQDGLDDWCENKLASKFRPELKSYSFDDVRGEPYFVVQPAWVAGYSPSQFPGVPVTTSNPIRIGYLLAYYEDFGDASAPFGGEPHIGDSEFIFVDVYYDGSDKHWKVQAAIGSAHWGAPTDGTEWAFFNIEFPDKYQGYPRFWVSEGKHANYVTRSRCNNAAFLQDDCPSPITTWRVGTSSGWNIGSRTHPAADVPFGSFGNRYTCVRSRNDLWRNLGILPGTECFWDESVFFAGWRSVPGVTGYATILNAFISPPV